MYCVLRIHLLKEVGEGDLRADIVTGHDER